MRGVSYGAALLLGNAPCIGPGRHVGMCTNTYRTELENKEAEENGNSISFAGDLFSPVPFPSSCPLSMLLRTIIIRKVFLLSILEVSQAYCYLFNIHADYLVSTLHPYFSDEKTEAEKEQTAL